MSIAVSTKIADFIIGGSELPGTYDNNSFLKELLTKMQFTGLESLKKECQGLTEIPATDKGTSDEKAASQTEEKG